jgi:anti-sigma-K factor RskA
MMGRSHEELKDLLVPYALGAVPEEEMAEIRAHILECEECMAEADSFADVAGSLAYAAAPEELPRGFADRVIDLVHEERGVNVATAAPRLASRWRLLEALSFAALLLVVGVLSFSLIDARQDVVYDRHVVSVLLDSDEGLKLDGSGARGAIVASDGDALFVAEGLEDPPSNHDYQLWLMHGDCASSTSSNCTVVSAGTFDGRDGIAIVRTSKPLHGYENAAVTIEPAGGSEAPTTTPVITSI